MLHEMRKRSCKKTLAILCMKHKLSAARVADEWNREATFRRSPAPFQFWTAFLAHNALSGEALVAAKGGSPISGGNSQLFDRVRQQFIETRIDA